MLLHKSSYLICDSVSFQNNISVVIFGGYLYDAAGEDNTGVPVNMTKLSSYLNVGRATLYRALSTLEEEGAVRKIGGCIIDISRKKLSEI